MAEQGANATISRLMDAETGAAAFTRMSCEFKDRLTSHSLFYRDDRADQRSSVRAGDGHWSTTFPSARQTVPIAIDGLAVAGTASRFEISLARRKDMDEAMARARIDAAFGTYHQAFGSFFITKLMGLEISYPDDFCLIRFPVEDFLFNPQGSYHGGMLATVMDISMGHLINHSTGIPGATLEMKNQYLRPLTKGPARCEGRYIRQGRGISFLESRVWDGDGKLTAHATSTWKMGETAAG